MIDDVILENEIVLNIGIDDKEYVVFYTDRLENVNRLYLCIMDRASQDLQDDNEWYEGKPIAEIVINECDNHYHVEGFYTLSKNNANPTEEDKVNRNLTREFINNHKNAIEYAINSYMSSHDSVTLN